MPPPNKFSNHLPFTDMSSWWDFRIQMKMENPCQEVLPTKQTRVTHKILICMLSFLEKNKTFRSSLHKKYLSSCYMLLLYWEGNELYVICLHHLQSKWRTWVHATLMFQCFAHINTYNLQTNPCNFTDEETLAQRHYCVKLPL